MHLPFVSFLDPDQMVGISEVQFGKMVALWRGSNAELIILDGDLIETALINAGEKVLSFLETKKNPALDRRRGWPYDTSS